MGKNEEHILTIANFEWFTNSGVALKCSWDLKDEEMVSVDIKIVPSAQNVGSVIFEFSITEFSSENDYEANEILKYYRLNFSLDHLNKCLLTKYNVRVDITLEQFLSRIGIL